MAKKQVIEEVEEEILNQNGFNLDDFQVETLEEKEVPIVNEVKETKDDDAQ